MRLLLIRLIRMRNRHVTIRCTAPCRPAERAVVAPPIPPLHTPTHRISSHRRKSTTSCGARLLTVASPPRRRYIVCANTGDSRAVLARAGQAVTLSNDHKPYLPEEKERIEKANGQVKFNRVNGDLAVSRALGDFVYKRCESVGAKEQAVTAFPEVGAPPRPLADAAACLARRAPVRCVACACAHTLVSPPWLSQIIAEERHEADQFIVLACDGIWDVMSSQEVVDKARSSPTRPP